MGRLIDEDKVLEVLCRELCHPGAGCPDGYCEEMREKLKDVPTAQPGWILCKERFPERGIDVLTYSEMVNFIEIQSIEPYFGMDCWENQHGDLQELNTVTAWMPLPKPYKGE